MAIDSGIMRYGVLFGLVRVDCVSLRSGYERIRTGY